MSWLLIYFYSLEYNSNRLLLSFFFHVPLCNHLVNSSFCFKQVLIEVSWNSTGCNTVLSASFHLQKAIKDNLTKCKLTWCCCWGTISYYSQSSTSFSLCSGAAQQQGCAIPLQAFKKSLSSHVAPSWEGEVCPIWELYLPHISGR